MPGLWGWLLFPLYDLPHTTYRLRKWLHGRVTTRVCFDSKQRKKTRLSCVESLNDTFILRAGFKGSPLHKSEDNGNQ